MPLLFTYDINRFSHDVAQQSNQNLNTHIDKSYLTIIQNVDESQLKFILKINC